MEDRDSPAEPESSLDVEAGGSSEHVERVCERVCERVDIRVCGSTPLLWKISDIKVCRREVGVIGALVGSLARQPRQNVRLGRPLEIRQEEALLLVQTGKATARIPSLV